MSKKEKKGFFCELKPITVANNVPAELKAIVNFYFEMEGDGRFKVIGYSSTGLMKEGQADLVEDEELETPEINGSFLENQKEIKFKIEPLRLFDSDIFFGSGVWLEYTNNGAVRQKYNVKVWDAGFESQRSNFLYSLFEKNKELSSNLSELSEELQRKEGKLIKLSENLQQAENNVGLINQQSNSLAENLAESKTQLNDLSVIKQELNDAKNELNTFVATNARLQKKSDDLLDKSKSIICASEKTQEEADKVLGSAVTVQLAKSFKERKEAAGRLRKDYDRVFYGSLALGMVVAVVLFNSGGIDQNSFLSYLHFFLTRLPMLVIPLWLGVFASKKSSLLTRLEEFYAQKQTLAESYEGYKNRMNEIGEEASEELIELMKINLFSLGRDSKTVVDGVDDEKHGPIEQMMNWRDRRKSKSSNVPAEEVDG